MAGLLVATLLTGALLGAVLVLHDIDAERTRFRRENALARARWRACHFMCPACCPTVTP